MIELVKDLTAILGCFFLIGCIIAAIFSPVILVVICAVSLIGG